TGWGGNTSLSDLRHDGCVVVQRPVLEDVFAITQGHLRAGGPRNTYPGDACKILPHVYDKRIGSDFRDSDGLDGSRDPDRWLHLRRELSRWPACLNRSLPRLWHCPQGVPALMLPP